jgi:hypothetical protein
MGFAGSQKGGYESGDYVIATSRLVLANVSVLGARRKPHLEAPEWEDVRLGLGVDAPLRGLVASFQ